MLLSKPRPGPGRTAAKGFSLIEALIAMLLFAIGFLGVAGLQLRGMHASKISLQRSTVVNLVDELADKIVANRQALVLDRDVYSDTSGTAVECYKASVTSCTAAQAARNDLEEFRKALTAAGLQGFQAQVCYDDTIDKTSTAAYATCDDDDSTLVIKVQWNSFANANSNESADTTSNFVYLPVLVVP